MEVITENIEKEFKMNKNYFDAIIHSDIINKTQIEFGVDIQIDTQNYILVIKGLESKIEQSISYMILNNYNYNKGINIDNYNYEINYDSIKELLNDKGYNGVKMNINCCNLNLQYQIKNPITPQEILHYDYYLENNKNKQLLDLKDYIIKLKTARDFILKKVRRLNWISEYILEKEEKDLKRTSSVSKEAKKIKYKIPLNDNSIFILIEILKESLPDFNIFDDVSISFYKSVISNIEEIINSIVNDDHYNLLYKSVGQNVRVSNRDEPQKTQLETIEESSLCNDDKDCENIPNMNICDKDNEICIKKNENEFSQFKLNYLIKKYLLEKDNDDGELNIYDNKYINLDCFNDQDELDSKQISGSCCEPLLYEKKSIEEIFDYDYNKKFLRIEKDKESPEINKIFKFRNMLHWWELNKEEENDNIKELIRIFNILRHQFLQQSKFEENKIENLIKKREIFKASIYNIPFEINDWFIECLKHSPSYKIRDEYQKSLKSNLMTLRAILLKFRIDIHNIDYKDSSQIQEYCSLFELDRESQLVQKVFDKIFTIKIDNLKNFGKTLREEKHMKDKDDIAKEGADAIDEMVREERIKALSEDKKDKKEKENERLKEFFRKAEQERIEAEKASEQAQDVEEKERLEKELAEKLEKEKNAKEEADKLEDDKEQSEKDEDEEHEENLMWEKLNPDIRQKLEESPVIGNEEVWEQMSNLQKKYIVDQLKKEEADKLEEEKKQEYNRMIMQIQKKNKEIFDIVYSYRYSPLNSKRRNTSEYQGSPKKRRQAGGGNIIHNQEELNNFNTKFSEKIKNNFEKMKEILEQSQIKEGEFYENQIQNIESEYQLNLDKLRSKTSELENEIKKHDSDTKFNAKILSLNQDFDHEAKGIVSRIECARSEALFHKFDTDHDGFVAPSELLLGLMTEPYGMKEEEISQLFQLMDLNSDDLLDVKEFCKGYEALEKAVRFTQEERQKKVDDNLDSPINFQKELENYSGIFDILFSELEKSNDILLNYNRKSIEAYKEYEKEFGENLNYFQKITEDKDVKLRQIRDYFENQISKYINEIYNIFETEENRKFSSQIDKISDANDSNEILINLQEIYGILDNLYSQKYRIIRDICSKFNECPSNILSSQPFNDIIGIETKVQKNTYLSISKLNNKFKLKIDSYIDKELESKKDSEVYSFFQNVTDDIKLKYDNYEENILNIYHLIKSQTKYLLDLLTENTNYKNIIQELNSVFEQIANKNMYEILLDEFEEYEYKNYEELIELGKDFQNYKIIIGVINSVQENEREFVWNICKFLIFSSVSYIDRMKRKFIRYKDGSLKTNIKKISSNMENFIEHKLLNIKTDLNENRLDLEKLVNIINKLKNIKLSIAEYNYQYKLNDLFRELNTKINKISTEDITANLDKQLKDYKKNKSSTPLELKALTEELDFTVILVEKGLDLFTNEYYNILKLRVDELKAKLIDQITENIKKNETIIYLEKENMDITPNIRNMVKLQEIEYLLDYYKEEYNLYNIEYIISEEKMKINYEKQTIDNIYDRKLDKILKKCELTGSKKKIECDLEIYFGIIENIKDDYSSFINLKTKIKDKDVIIKKNIDFTILIDIKRILDIFFSLFNFPLSDSKLLNMNILIPILGDGDYNLGKIPSLMKEITKINNINYGSTKMNFIKFLDISNSKEKSYLDTINFKDFISSQSSIEYKKQNYFAADRGALEKAMQTNEVLKQMSAEEKAAALANMSPSERAAAMAMMSPEDTEATLCAMSPDERAAAFAAMSPGERAASLATMSPYFEGLWNINKDANIGDEKFIDLYINVISNYFIQNNKFLVIKYIYEQKNNLELFMNIFQLTIENILELIKKETESVNVLVQTKNEYLIELVVKIGSYFKYLELNENLFSIVKKYIGDIIKHILEIYSIIFKKEPKDYDFYVSKYGNQVYLLCDKIETKYLNDESVGGKNKKTKNRRIKIKKTLKNNMLI
jgi:hypothetical protein